MMMKRIKKIMIIRIVANLTLSNNTSPLNLTMKRRAVVASHKKERTIMLTLN